MLFNQSMKRFVYPSLLVFHSVFLPLENDFKIVRYICIILLFVYLSDKWRYFLNKKYNYINIWLLLFDIAVLFSSFHMVYIKLPASFHAVSPFSGVLLILCVTGIFFFIEYLNEKRNVSAFLHMAYYLSVGYLCINDVFLLRQMPSVSGKESTDILYLLGNKFAVSYMHFFWLALYYQNNIVKIEQGRLWELLFLSAHIVVTALISYAVECSTAIVGISFMVIFLYCYKKMPWLYNPWGGLVLLLLFDTFFLFYEVVLDIPFIQYLIEDVLHEDLTLTGRTVIYAKMFDLIEDQPWFGYGNGTATFFTQYYVNMPNTQNGLLNDYIDWGIVGVLLFVLLFYFVVKHIDYNSSRKNPFLCLLYTYIVLSSIEITLGLCFLAILPLSLFSDRKNVFPY